MKEKLKIKFPKKEKEYSKEHPFGKTKQKWSK